MVGEELNQTGKQKVRSQGPPGRRCSPAGAQSCSGTQVSSCCLPGSVSQGSLGPATAIHSSLPGPRDSGMASTAPKRLTSVCQRTEKAQGKSENSAEAIAPPLLVSSYLVLKSPGASILLF